MDPNETWLPVHDPYFEEHYAVSSFGRVARYSFYHQHFRVLKTGPNTNGYLQVNLTLANAFGRGQRTFEVHRLVARAFLGPPPKGQETDHIDRDKLNAALSNLRYLTRKENASNGNALQRRGAARAFRCFWHEILRALVVRGSYSL